jgi:hypothetical protein
VEQRHHAHRRVVRVELVGVRDDSRRRDEVALPDRHSLWFARCAAGVQEERQCVGITGADQRVAGSAVDLQQVVVEPDDARRNARRRGGRGGLGASVVEQPRHSQIVKFAGELRRSERGIERGRCRAERPHSEEGCDHGGAASGEDRHVVSGAQAKLSEAPRRSVERALQRGVRDDRAGLGHHQRGMVIGPLDEGPNRGAFSEGHDARPSHVSPAAFMPSMASAPVLVRRRPAVLSRQSSRVPWFRFGPEFTR